MDVSVQYVGPVKEDLISPNDWGLLWGNCKRGSNTVSSLVAELGSALEDALVLLSTSAPPLKGCEVCCPEKEKECGELIIDQDESLTVTSQEDLEEHRMPLCSRNMLSCDASMSGKDSISITALDGQSCLDSGNLTSTSIMRLPVVSAMKGSREKQGLNVGKPSVSWAPDVYDPPVTSQSHSVKSHNQHGSMMSKKSYRHKHKHKHKGKSQQSNNADKKQHHKTTRRTSSKVASY